jgi:hypothetical protein
VTPRQEAQREAEKTYIAFLDKSKKVIIAMIVVLLFVGLVSDFKTPTRYNGEVYNPQNMGDKIK